MPHRLIIDTDTAADDCFALLVGLLDPAAELCAITMVAGNVGYAQQVRNALITLGQAGRAGEVPVFSGCDRPLVRPWASAEYVHGDGKGGVDFPVPDQAVEDEHGVDALIRLVREAPGEISIVAIGPLTNIAMAARRDPSFAANVKSLHIMGGANNARGNITPAAEYNFYVDPEAAKIVFGAGFDITVVTWTLTLAQAVFDDTRLRAIAELDTPLSRFYDVVNHPTLEFDRSVGIDGSTHPDSLTAAVLLHPELIRRTGRYRVDVETQGELTRGYSVFDWGVFGTEPNATVVEEIDADGFYDYLVGILSTEIGG